MKEKIVAALGFLKIEGLYDLLEIPKERELGDYSLPCFALAKKLKKSPNDIAKEIAEKISKKGFDRVVASGGYVNFFFDKKELAEKVIKEINKKGEDYGKIMGKGKIMVEFSQPNTHKAFHVGHIRGTSLGESIARIAEFCGNKVVRANYSGDTGMHIAKWIWCYRKYHGKEKLKGDEKWFADIYVDAVKKLEKSPKIQEEVDEINRKLDSGVDKELNKLWKDTRKLSIKSWERIYRELNTRFDVHIFESEVEKEGREIVMEIVKRKIAKESEGAIIVDFNEHGRPDLGVLVLLRKDGTVLYGAKDLALAKNKLEKHKLDKSIYVIGKAQERYVYQIFEILKLMGMKGSEKNIYVPVNEVRFPWGKMASRSGDNIFYSDFRDNMIEIARKEIKKREASISEKGAQKRALAITISVMKYSMLKQDVNKNIIFDPKKEIKFDGDTGPYLLYSYARARNIIKKAGHKIDSNFEIYGIGDSEKKIVELMASFPEVVKEAEQKLSPSTIAHFSYDLAKAFNEFYHECPVIGSENEKFRLKLVDSFSQVLKNSLRLLGINTIAKM